MKPKMIPRWTLIVAVMLAAIALMTGVALARPGGAMFGAMSNHTPNDTANQPDALMLIGGHYQLTSIVLSYTPDDISQDNEIASGGGYHLQVLTKPRLAGSGCCCLYLPCILK
jgi:hypothetical protein